VIRSRFLLLCIFILFCVCISAFGAKNVFVILYWSCYLFGCKMATLIFLTSFHYFCSSLWLKMHHFLLHCLCDDDDDDDDDVIIDTAAGSARKWSGPVETEAGIGSAVLVSRAHLPGLRCAAVSR